MRQRSNRSIVGMVDSEARSPTAGVAGSGLSGTACRLAALLRGRHSRHEDGRLNRSVLLPDAGIDGLHWCLHLECAVVCTQAAALSNRDMRFLSR